MPPIQSNPFVHAIRMLLMRYNSYYLSKKSKSTYKLHPQKKRAPNKPIIDMKPLNTLFQGLSSTIKQITKKPEREDYNALIKSFLPENTKPIIPKSPRESKDIYFADIDGDTQNELITSFMHSNELRTIILKKQNGGWNKIYEIINPGFEAINYRSVADITGEGKKQLLIGLKSKDKGASLHGYSFEGNKFNKIFEHDYHRFEVLESPKTRNVPAKTQLAIWDKKDKDTYNIELMHWNKTQLEPLENTASYYYRSVVPYYAQKVKHLPGSPSNWYNLADALNKAGLRREALLAVRVGMSQDKISEFNESFLKLKNKINKK